VEPNHRLTHNKPLAMLVKFLPKIWGCSNTENTPSYGPACGQLDQQQLGQVIVND